MAVSMMSSSNYRADFMISDAALPQRLEQLDKEQTMQFAKILNDFGSAETGVPSAEQLTVISTDAKTPDGGTSTESPALTLPDDAMALARMVVNKEIGIEDIPAEMITPDLLKAIAIVKRMTKDENGEEEQELKTKDEDHWKNTVFNPAEAAVLWQLISAESREQMLLEVYEIIEKYNEKKAEDKVTMLDGISEPIPEFPQAEDVLPFPIDSEKKDDSNSPLFADFIDHLVETVAAEQERVNADQFVSGGKTPADELLDPVPEQPENAAIDEAGSANLDILANAVKNGEVEQPTVRTTEVEEKAQVDVPSVSESESAKTGAYDDRAKAISEELEMLKNAKLGKTEKTEEKPEAKPVQTATPFNADSPITLTRRDGGEIRVRPSEVVAQATKLVERAISENKEQTEYSLVLNPEELGKITVKLIKASDGAISVTIAAESARTQRILEQNSELMQNNLRSSGIQLESWQTVQESQQETLAQDYNGSSKNPYYREDNSESDEDPDEKSFAEIIAAM